MAAASLGQVYRCTLQPSLGGGDVAVKVQRPGVLEAVALDLYLMRSTASIMQQTLKVHGKMSLRPNGYMGILLQTFSWMLPFHASLSPLSARLLMTGAHLSNLTLCSHPV